jgi:lysophospholipid acyltransferase (LPLAT)-like uncharacterized protein
MIPLPFSKAAFVAGEPIYVPSVLDEETSQKIAAEIERAMNRCERRAEELTGHAFPEEYPV